MKPGWLFIILIALSSASAAPTVSDRLGTAEQALRYGNYHQALELFHELAQLGNPDAMIGLGRMYQAGQGVPIAHNTAKQWFEKAIITLNQRARKNDPRAFATFGVLFNDGIAFKQNKEKARQYFQTAFRLAHEKALQGHLDEQYLTGVLYSSGKGVQRDIYTGVQWLTAAGQNGHKTAIQMLIYLYDCNCRGFPQDKTQAAFWRKQLIDLNQFE